jgi:hypothetical protein
MVPGSDNGHGFRSRHPAMVTVPGNGPRPRSHGRDRRGEPRRELRENGPRGAAARRGSSKHRLSVTFGFASAPARLPSATRNATTNRLPTVASGRLDGLPRPRYTLLRYALPEDSVWPDGPRVPPSCAGGPKPATRPLRPKGLRSPWQGPLAAPIGVMPGWTFRTSQSNANGEMSNPARPTGTPHFVHRGARESRALLST